MGDGKKSGTYYENKPKCFWVVLDVQAASCPTNLIKL